MTFKDKLSMTVMGAVLCLVGYITVYGLTPPAQAQDTPRYGTFPYTVAVTSSTGDMEALAAPGADMRWVVTGVGWNILVEEADKLVRITDMSGCVTFGGAVTGQTTVAIAEFAPETQGFGQWIDLGEGIPCATNSAVMVDLTSADTGALGTADVYVVVTGYKERTQ